MPVSYTRCLLLIDTLLLPISCLQLYGTHSMAHTSCLQLYGTHSMAHTSYLQLYGTHSVAHTSCLQLYGTHSMAHTSCLQLYGTHSMAHTSCLQLHGTPWLNTWLWKLTHFAFVRLIITKHFIRLNIYMLVFLPSISCYSQGLHTPYRWGCG